MKRRIVNTKDVGQVVREARKEQGLTQKELADVFSGFSREFLSDLENGKPSVQLDKALAVAHTLGLRIYIEADSLLKEEASS